MTYDYENSSITEKKALCREAYNVFGRLAAEQLWRKLDLPGDFNPVT